MTHFRDYPEELLMTLTVTHRRACLGAAFAVLALATGAAHAAGPTGLLNDTGQTTCYDGSAMVACSAANTGDAATYPRQDGRFGRDKAGMAKVGGGAAGFDFTKICWNGDAEGSGTCTGALLANTSGTTTGTPSTDWACTRDNVTNLVWSLQTVSSITWANATSVAAGKPIELANTASRCGFSSGWRVPTRRELLSIAHFGASSPAIDVTYFPSTVSNFYWSNDSQLVGGGAWTVGFNYGDGVGYDKANARLVRLVRSGP